MRHTDASLLVQSWALRRTPTSRTQTWRASQSRNPHRLSACLTLLLSALNHAEAAAVCRAGLRDVCDKRDLHRGLRPGWSDNYAAPGCLQTSGVGAEHLVSAANLRLLCAELGFETCATSVTYIADSDLTGQTFTQPAQPIQAGSWQFFAFNVTQDKFQVVMNVDEDPAANCKPLSLLCSASACERSSACTALPSAR